MLKDVFMSLAYVVGICFLIIVLYGIVSVVVGKILTAISDFLDKLLKK